MGYKPTKKVYELRFTDFPGLEIDAVSTSLGKLMQIGQLNVQINDPDPAKRLELFSAFADCMVRWNIEHPALSDENKQPDSMACAACGLAEDEPMPCTVTSLQCLDLDFIMPLIFGWIATISRVSFPKELSLNSGALNIPEEVMNKLAQHPNLSTLPTPNFS